MEKIVCGGNYTTNLIKDNINELIDESALVKGYVTALQSDVVTLEGDVTTLQTDSTSLRTDVDGLIDLSGDCSFDVSVSSLNLTVSAFSIGDFNYIGGTVTAIDNITQYLCLNPLSGRLHVLRRDYDTTLIYIAKVSASGGMVTSIERRQKKLPTITASKSILKLTSGLENVEIGIMGSSLQAGSGSGNKWTQLLFDSSLSASGYNVVNVESVNVDNFAVGGQDAAYSLSLLSKPLLSFGGNYPDTSFISDAPLLIKSALTKEKAFNLNDSLLAKSDVVIVGLLANDGYTQHDYYESTIRKLRMLNVEVLIVTDNDFATNNLHYDAGSFVKYLSDKYNLTLLDTASYVRELHDKGINPWDDAIHMNQDGHNAWAECILSAFNSKCEYSNQKTVERYDLAPSQSFPSSDICFDVIDLSGVKPKTLGGSGLAFLRNYGFTSAQYTEVLSGESFKTGHPFHFGYSLIVDGGTDFTMEVSRNNNPSVVLKTISNTAHPRTKHIEVFPPLDDIFSSGLGSYSTNITITSGSIRILGIRYYTVEYDNVTSEIETDDEAMIRTTGWYAQQNLCNSGLCTNTLNKSLFIGHDKCREIIPIVQSYAWSGQVEILGTGFNQSLDLYETGKYYKPIRANQKSGLGKKYVRIEYTGDNTNVSVVTDQSHTRLYIPTAIAVLDR